MNSRLSNDARLTSTINNCRLIVVGCMFGLIVFGFIASIVGGEVRSSVPVLAYLALAFAAQVTAVRQFIPDLFVKSQLKALKNERAGSIAERLEELFQTKLIIGVALLQGAALFNLIAYVLNGQWFSLATAAFMLALMGMMFPTVHGFEKWAEEIERNLRSSF